MRRNMRALTGGLALLMAMGALTTGAPPTSAAPAPTGTVQMIVNPLEGVTATEMQIRFTSLGADPITATVPVKSVDFTDIQLPLGTWSIETRGLPDRHFATNVRCGGVSAQTPNTVTPTTFPVRCLVTVVYQPLVTSVLWEGAPSSAVSPAPAKAKQVWQVPGCATSPGLPSVRIFYVGALDRPVSMDRVRAADQEVQSMRGWFAHQTRGQGPRVACGPGGTPVTAVTPPWNLADFVAAGDMGPYLLTEWLRNGGWVTDPQTLVVLLVDPPMEGEGTKDWCGWAPAGDPGGAHQPMVVLQIAVCGLTPQGQPWPTRFSYVLAHELGHALIASVSTSTVRTSPNMDPTQHFRDFPDLLWNGAWSALYWWNITFDVGKNDYFGRKAPLDVGQSRFWDPVAAQRAEGQEGEGCGREQVSRLSRVRRASLLPAGMVGQPPTFGPGCWS